METENIDDGSCDHDPAMNSWHWLWMGPCAMLLSPIGWIVIQKGFELDIRAGAILAATQVLIFALIYILSNGGE